MDYDTSRSTSSTEDVAGKAQETASTLVTQAQEVASAQANTQMARAADALDSVSRTLQSSGADMGEQQPQVAQIANQAAQRIDQMSGYLREHDLSDVIADAENYARREPLLFLGAAFAVGFVAARFFKASSPYGSSRALVPYSDDFRYGSPGWSGSTITPPTSGRYESDDYQPATPASAGR